MPPRASQARPKRCPRPPKTVLFPPCCPNGSAVQRFRKTYEKQMLFYVFFGGCFFLLLFIFLPSPQGPPGHRRGSRRAPGSSQGLPKSPLRKKLKPMEVLNCPFLTLLSFSCRNLAGRQGRKWPIQRTLSGVHGSPQLPFLDFA